MKIIIAVYENGVFRPVEPVDLPEHSRVRIEPESKNETKAAPEVQDQDAIHEILSRRYHTGDPYLSERHNEHQP